MITGKAQRLPTTRRVISLLHLQEEQYTHCHLTGGDFIHSILSWQDGSSEFTRNTNVLLVQFKEVQLPNMAEQMTTSSIPENIYIRGGDLLCNNNQNKWFCRVVRKIIRQV
jgi:hypothetical protein